ncbi:hypothetical protein Bhyg_12985 [Pseudolycoriella hygida]|uniref:Uncharacterized protein n=1 Tax=Pseudolycoriella hygida TaxID=35572 RepID=A0A9Q0MZU7_9DIPT|nr:hypothetical protein Bhyg_12985 [Pseudolycoriella hygida]
MSNDLKLEQSSVYLRSKFWKKMITAHTDLRTIEMIEFKKIRAFYWSDFENSSPESKLDTSK